MAAKIDIIAKVTELLEPLLVGQGLELVEVEFTRPQKGRATLRIFADRPGGITLEELARVSRVAGDLLEVHDIIPWAYNLEVSSPGLTRALKKPEDYQRYRGRLVRLTTHGPWEGRQVHTGILQGLEGGQVSLETDGRVYRIPLEEIAKARLEIDWKNLRKEA